MSSESECIREHPCSKEKPIDKLYRFSYFGVSLRLRFCSVFWSRRAAADIYRSCSSISASAPFSHVLTDKPSNESGRSGLGFAIRKAININYSSFFIFKLLIYTTRFSFPFLCFNKKTAINTKTLEFF